MAIQTKKIEITMLGRFTIIANGKDIVGSLGSSRKKIELLAFLILNKGRNISAADLCEILWPNDENTNPESSLKTLMSRLRANLDEFGLKKAIMTKRGFYFWNSEILCDIDVMVLESLARDVGAASSLTKTVEDKCRKILALYQGELLPNIGMDSWLVSRSLYYQGLFVESIHTYVDFLKKESRYEDVVAVCRRGLDVDADDSSLNLDLMIALVKLGRSTEALALYNATTGMHHAYLGNNPSDEIIDFYRKLIEMERSSTNDIDDIRRELWDEDKESGAFLCDYSTFKEIYKLNMRNLKRLGTSVFIAMFSVDTIDNSAHDFLTLDRIMGMLQDTLRGNLRRGDTVARYSPYQFVVLLPTVNHQTGQGVLERIRQEFYAVCSSSQYVLNSKLKPINREE